MVTAVAGADQGTSKSSVTAVLVRLLHGSQLTSFWLWGHWEKYLLFFLFSIKIIFWLFQMIVVSYNGAEQHKSVTSSDFRAVRIPPGWFNKGQDLKIACKRIIFEKQEKADGSVPGQSYFSEKEESFLSPVTSSLLDHCPIFRAAIRLILVKLHLVLKFIPQV